MENPPESHPSYTGPTGTLHTYSAQSKEPTSFGIGLTGRFFNKTPFIDDQKHSRAGVRLALNYSLPYQLELFSGFSFTFNEHSTLAASQSSTSLFENVDLGVKWTLPWSGEHLQYAILGHGRTFTGTQVRRNTSGFSRNRSGPHLQAFLYALGTWDIEKMSPSFPAKLHFNLGYRSPNSNLSIPEAPGFPRATHVDQFALDAMGYHSMLGSLALEARYPYVSPFLEYHWEYAFGTGNDPTTWKSNRHSAILGARARPHESFSILLAGQLGLFGKTAGERIQIPENPPWEVYAGVTFSSIGRTLFEAEGRVRGYIRDRETGLGIAGASVRVPGSPRLPAVSSSSGSYEMIRLPDGSYQLQFEAEGYETVTRNVEIRRGSAVVADVELRLLGSRTGELTAQFRRADTDEPISRAVVSLSDVDQNFSSDETGRVRLRQVPEGPKFMRVEAPGFLPADFSVEIFADEAIAQTFYLQPEPEQFGVCGGIVKNPDGNGLTAVLTDLSGEISPFGTNPLTGEFRQVLKQGTHNFRVQAENYLPTEISCEVLAGEDLYIEITLNRPERATLIEDQIVLPDAIYFAFDSDRIEERSFEILDQVVEVLSQVSDFGKLRIEGHTDSTGSTDYNIRLSTRRAEAVRQYLINQGLDADRLISEGYGPHRPVATNETDAGRAENRRVEFHLDRRP